MSGPVRRLNFPNCQVLAQCRDVFLPRKFQAVLECLYRRLAVAPAPRRPRRAFVQAALVLSVLHRPPHVGHRRSPGRACLPRRAHPLSSRRRSARARGCQLRLSHPSFLTFLQARCGRGPMRRSGRIRPRLPVASLVRHSSHPAERSMRCDSHSSQNPADSRRACCYFARDVTLSHVLSLPPRGALRLFRPRTMNKRDPQASAGGKKTGILNEQRQDRRRFVKKLAKKAAYAAPLLISFTSRDAFAASADPLGSTIF